MYQSSQSAQGLSSSQLQDQDSGIGESSPPPELPVPTAFGEDGIVPDSQALPDSSSHKPTSSNSVDIPSATDTAGTGRGRNHLTINTQVITESSNAPVAESSDQIEDPTHPITPSKTVTESSNARVEESSEKVKDLTYPIIPFKPKSKLDSQRSTSTPAQQQTENPPSSATEASPATEPTPFSRTHSDLGPPTQNGQEATPSPALEPSTSSTASQSKAFQGGQVIPTNPTVVDSPNLETASNSVLADSPREAEVSGSVEYHSPENPSGTYSSGQELIFQTQVPLILDTQVSDQIHTPISTIGE